MTVSKTRYQNLTDFDTNSGVAESASVYKTISPSFELTTGDYIIDDVGGDFDNVALTAWLRLSSVSNGKARVILGSNVGGTAGQAVDVIFGASNWKVEFNDITGFATTGSATNASKEFKTRGFDFSVDTFFPLKIWLAGPYIQVSFNNVWCFEDDSFSATDSYWGLSGIDTGTTSYLSDVDFYQDQVFYGNVNINAAPQSNAKSMMFNQDSPEVLWHADTNADGEYILFNPDDPVDATKYFMIGYTKDRQDIQPRGVGNITL